jgi:photosystem II stability/assembly factor-like uncharacterized protein
LRTADGGTNWHQLHSGPTGRDYVRLQMLDTQTGWLLERQSHPTVNNWIHRTSDGWSTWTPVFETTQGVFAMHWADGNRGWIGTGEGLYTTQDGGQTWDLALSGSAIESVFFLNTAEGWCSSYRTVYRTSDGGQTWQSVDVTSIWGTIDKIQFMNSLDGWLIEKEYSLNYEAGRVLVSHDGGASWTVQLFVGGSFGPYVHFADIEMLNARVGFVCADDGALFRTSNGGNVWTEIGLADDTRALEFTDTTTGWSVGSYGAIRHTVDEGLTWQRQHGGTLIASSELSDLQFVDARVGFATGRSSILKTADGGATWQHVPIDPTPLPFGSISASYFRDENRGWFAWDKNAGWGAILNTTDGGQTVNIQADDIYRCFDIFFINDNVGWAIGHKLYGTTDGGQNWIEHPLPSQEEYYCISFIDPLEGWVGGITGSVLHTTDGGQTWSSRDIGHNAYIRSLIFRDEQLGIAVGYYYPDGLVFRTVDGGENWENVLTVPNAILTDGVLTFDSYVYVVGSGMNSPRDLSHFLKSTDEGVTWEAQTEVPLADGIFQIAAHDPWHIWLLGPGGSIAYGPLGTGTGSPAAGASGTQLFQNYPNPFNPLTTIAYHLTSTSGVELTVFSIAGERVRRWVRASQDAGQHRITWDGRDATGRSVASGIYFYRLKAGNVVKTRKMLLLK